MMGIRQRKQQEEVGFPSPYPFLRRSGWEGANFATSVGRFMFIT